ncbi:hypothetical protein CCP2SC5_620007 [Azospirillaceae bacterium]
MKPDELTTESEVTLELAPLVDILFLIVLFFAVSSTLISPQELTKLRDLLNRATVESQSLNQQIDANRRAYEEKNAHIAQIQSQFALAKAQIVEQTVEINRQRDEIAQKRNEIVQIEERLAETRKDLAQKSQDIVEQQSRLTEIQKKLAAQTAEYADIERKQQDLTTQAARIVELETHLAAAQSQSSASVARIAALEQEITVKTEAAAVQAQHIAILDQDLSKIRAELAQITAREQGQRTQNSGANGRLAQMEQEIRRLSEERARLEQNLNQERQERQEESKRQSPATAELTQLRLKISQLNEDKNTLTEANKKLQALAEADQQRLGLITETQQRLSANLQSLIEDKTLGVQRANDRFVLELSDKVLFDSGNDQIKPAGAAILTKIGKSLAQRAQNMQVQVGGHTDDRPIAGRSRFTSNWALSAARAVAVVRFLENESAIPSAILSAVGYGEFQPIAANANDEGRAKNRRIEIVLMAR